MNNETDISLKFTNKVTGEAKLEKYDAILKSLSTTMKKMPKGTDLGNLQGINDYSQILNKISGQLDTVIKKTSKLKLANKSLGGSFSSAFNVATLSAFIVALKKIYNVFGDLIKKSSSYLENINLYQVAFNGVYEEADRFVNKLSEMYGLDESWGVRTVGIFRQLANAMGLAVEQADSLSYLMTQMSIDISSLFNVDVDRASQVLQSALAGQTRPIRSVTGADITMNTLQQTLNDLNIDKAVNQLSFAEKRLVIIISLTKQLTQATNDWGRTIESPANQTRILSEQWERLTRAIGNVFLPIIAKVLPIVNGILMALTEIINIIAGLVGYKQDDFDYFTGIADSVLDLEEGLDGATESAKKLKQGLRGFDKLNVISTPSASTSGVGSGGGISGDILEAYNKAYKEYMDKLDNVRMRATEIRDKIMEWLGFTKQIDEVTGDVSFKFDHITGGTVLGALAVGGAIFRGIQIIFTLLSKMANFTGLSKIFAGIGSATGITALFKDIGAGIELIAEGSPVGGVLKELAPALGKVASTLGGIFSLVFGIFDLFGGINDIVSETDDTAKGIFKTIKGVAEVVAGIALFIPGGQIVALVAGIIAGIMAIVDIIYTNWDAISSWFAGIPDWFNTTVIEPVKGFFTGIWDWLYSTIIEPVAEFFTGVAEWFYETVIAPIIEFFSPIWEAIKSIFDAIVENVTSIVTGVFNAVKSIVAKLWEILAKIIEIFVALIKAGYEYIVKPIWDFITSIPGWVYDNVIEPVLEILKDAWDWFDENIIKPVVDFFKSVWGWFKEHIIDPIANFFKGVATWVYENVILKIWDKIVWLRDKAVSIFKTIGTTVVNFIGDSIKAVINAVLSGIEWTINGFIKLLNGAISLINKIPGVNITKVTELSIPRLKSGMDFVPRDYYPAYLDYGERVLTAQENKEYTAMKENGGIGNKQTSFNPTFIIQVGDDEVAKHTINKLEEMARADGKAITIGG